MMFDLYPITWTAISAIIGLGVIIVAVFSNKQTKKQFHEQFKEEFRPLLTITLEKREKDHILFMVTNVGKRPAYNFSIEYRVFFYAIDNYNYEQSREPQQILDKERCLPPEGYLIVKSLKNDSIINSTNTIDAVLRYESVNHDKFKEKMVVNLGDPIRDWQTAKNYK